MSRIVSMLMGTLVALAACGEGPTDPSAPRPLADRRCTVTPPPAAAAESLIVFASGIGTGVDNGPQDGVFDVFAPFNLGSIVNNGWTSYRTAAEFSLSGIPVGRTIAAARLVYAISNWEGNRQVEIHSYSGNGSFELADLAQNGLAGSQAVPPGGTWGYLAEVSNAVSQVAGSGATFVGFSFRESPANSANYLIMNLVVTAQSPYLVLVLRPAAGSGGDDDCDGDRDDGDDDRGGHKNPHKKHDDHRKSEHGR